jgi:osmotically-inducible protein OsmY
MDPIRVMSAADSELAAAVRAELEWDTRVSASDIGVEVVNGTVTLVGRVDALAQRLAAQEAAHRVRGVLDVVNEVRVMPAPDDRLSDVEIAHAVRHALAHPPLAPLAPHPPLAPLAPHDSRLPHERIHTTVTDGVVVLEGSVPYPSHHDDAGRVASTVRGVRDVKNLIRVEPPIVPEGALRQTILDALLRHAEHSAHHVEISIDGNVVTLSGDVASPAELLAVVGAVRGMPGIAAVENRLHVR